MATPVRVGTDSSGRAIWMTPTMKAWWEAYVRHLGFTPTITQGPWQEKNGGGADASAGYHDKGAALDLRVWDRTPDEVGKMIREARRGGAPAWLRDLAHGNFSDAHVHLAVPDDLPMDDGLAAQVDAYVRGRDGLASNGPDYHWRPVPLVLSAPAAWLKRPKTNVEKARAKIAVALDLLKAVPKNRTVVWTQRRVIRDALRKMPKA